ncbi:choice-of-anchor B domain-containing protein [Natronospira proteinivora]|uniref:Choice-of-anchor B domain-containing protein n=1 Tax=Natronospira proteinivora TaxID=1807133 RepID=A0ABT1G9Q3_9GAMM|nr:choice-of-anchor B family protein [Natronospira proteinivora]MCP1727053.1 choice-of-anchor B domain-containing protein [Natronospira proteinivora]
MRISITITALLLSSFAVAGEQPCEDGTAGPYPCSRVDLAAFMPIEEIGGEGQSLNDVWGWTDPDSGREFALVGRSGGTSFVEVSDPASPVYLGDLPTRSLTTHRPGEPRLAMQKTEQPVHGRDARLFCHDDCDAPGGAWRDAKVYQHYALIVSEEAGHGLQIFDLTRLLDVESGAPETFDEDAHYDGFGNAHNLELNSETGMAYAVGTSNADARHNYNGGPHFVDVSDPLMPSHAGGYGGDGYTHDAQCVIYQGPDEGFQGDEICFNSNEDSLTLVNVSDHDSPQLISRSDYPRVGYTHQGWLSEDHRWFYLNDETADLNDNSRTRTLVFDVAELAAPELAYEYYSPDLAIAHNNYVRGDYLYQSNYTSGLRILDVSTPDRPVEAAYLDTQPDSEEHTFRGTWSNYPWFESGTVVFTDIEDGLFVVRPRLPEDSDDGADLSVSGMIESHGSNGQDFALSTRITVENLGPEDASGVEFVASLPASGELAVTGEQPGACDSSERVLRCRYGTLATGASFVVDLTAEADEAVDEGLIVWAVSDQHDPDTANNRQVLPRDGQASQPIASFRYDCHDLSCEFDASDSKGGTTGIESLSWSFGDGSTGEGEQISHEYPQGGEYTVTLTVNNEADENAETSRTVSVSAPARDSADSSSSSFGCSISQRGPLAGQTKVVDRFDPLLAAMLLLAVAGLLGGRRRVG